MRLFAEFLKEQLFNSLSVVSSHNGLKKLVKNYLTEILKRRVRNKIEKNEELLTHFLNSNTLNHYIKLKFIMTKHLTTTREGIFSCHMEAKALGAMLCVSLKMRLYAFLFLTLNDLILSKIICL